MYKCCNTPKEFKRGIGSFFDPCVNAMGRRTYWLSLGWWVIVPLNLAQSFGLVSLRHDSPCDNLNACVIYVHARKATHAKQNYLAGLATKNKTKQNKTKQKKNKTKQKKKQKKKNKKQKKKKNGDTVSHLHTWGQDGWLPQQISPFINFNTPQFLWFL